MASIVRALKTLGGSAAAAYLVAILVLFSISVQVSGICKQYGFNMPPIKHVLKKTFQKVDIKSAILSVLWATASTMLMAQIWPTKLPYEAQGFKDLHALARDVNHITDQERLTAQRRAAQSIEDARREKEQAHRREYEANPKLILDLCRVARNELYGQIAHLLGSRAIEQRSVKQKASKMTM